MESPKVEIEEPLEPEETIEVPAESEPVEVEEKVPDQVTETLMLQETIGEMESVAEVNAEEKQMEMEKKVQEEVQEFVETMAVPTEEEKEIEVAEGEIVNVVEAAVEEEMVQVEEPAEEPAEEKPVEEPKALAPVVVHNLQRASSLEILEEHSHWQRRSHRCSCPCSCSKGGEASETKTPQAFLS